jgi:hypothetical protein
MSHAATNWALKQRGIKPAAKIVLWHLCDRYHPDNGCFPSLETLAEDCEMSRRSVQDQIAALEEAGLLRVEKMPRIDGRLPRNRYVFPFEQDENTLGQNLPRAKSALGKSACEPWANSRNHLGQNLPTNLVRVTSKRTSKDARARADAGAVSILSEVVPAETAEAFAQHRRVKRAKLTEQAATLIANKLRHCRNPVAAVEEAIANGWTGVFPREGPEPRDAQAIPQSNFDDVIRKALGNA